jgi:hypothetical protein
LGAAINHAKANNDDKAQQKCRLTKKSIVHKQAPLQYFPQDNIRILHQDTPPQEMRSSLGKLPSSLHGG